MAARLVSSVRTTRQVRGCCSRYFLTVFLDSPTLTARTVRRLCLNSWESRATRGASSAQKWHQVVHNSRRTTLPFIPALSNFSPSRVLALKRGAGSILALLAAKARVAAQIRNANARDLFR